MKACTDEACPIPATKLVMVYVRLKGREDGFLAGGLEHKGWPYCTDHAEKLDPKTVARTIPRLPEGEIDVDRSEKAIHELSWYEPGGKFFKGRG